MNAAEISDAFGKYGFIAKIEIYGNTAYVNYADRYDRGKQLILSILFYLFIIHYFLVL